MRITTAVVAAAVCASWAGTSRAAGSTAARPHRLPLSGVLMSEAPVRQEVIARIQSLSAGAAAQPSLSAESAAIVQGLLSRPEVVRRHSAELSSVLGPGVTSLIDELGRSLGTKKEPGVDAGIDPSSVGELSHAVEKLQGRLFDGTNKAGENAVVEGSAAQAAVPPQWRLSPHQKIYRSAPGEEPKAFEMLTRVLKQMELPPYTEKFIEEKVSEPLVAWMGLPSVWKMAIWREGGRQDPGNVQYILDPSWVIQVPGADGRNVNYATKGVYFDKDGKSAIVATYKHPRRIRYFSNLLTLGAFDTAAGVPLERNAAMPMSSSSRLEAVTNDKLLTRLLMAEVGVRVPATRAFLLTDHPFLKKGGAMPGSEKVKAGPLPEDRAAVRAAVVEFLNRFKGPEVVVKPSGARFHSGEGVGFFGRGDVDGITDYVVSLARHPHMDSVGAVLLEQRLMTPPNYYRFHPYSGSGRFVYIDKKKYGVEALSAQDSSAPHERKDYNERVYGVLDKDGRPHTPAVTFFRAGTWGMPTSSQPRDPRDAAAVLDFETMRAGWAAQYGGLMSTQREVDEFLREREEMTNKTLMAIRAHEETLARRDGDPFLDRTDMIGLDRMFQLEDGKLVPYVIEVNDHDAAGQHAIDLFYPDRVGEHSRVWVEAMRHRARTDAQLNP